MWAQLISARLKPGKEQELPKLFDQLKADISDPTPADHAVAALMNAYWATFAKTGDPNGAGLPAWPVYTSTHDQLLDFGPDGEARAVADPRKERLDLVAGRTLGVSP